MRALGISIGLPIFKIFITPTCLSNASALSEQDLKGFITYLCNCALMNVNKFGRSYNLGKSIDNVLLLMNA